MKVKSVTDKINDTFQNSSDDDSSDFDNNAQVADFDITEYDIPDFRSKSSEFRKRNVKLLSEQSNKYKGKIVFRKELNVDDDSSECGSLEDMMYSACNESGSQNDSIKDEQSEMDNSTSEDDSDSVELDSNNGDAIVEKKCQEDEIRKGNCVQNQLRIWERLLEMRIITQKLLTKSNQMSIKKDHPIFTSEKSRETIENTFLLLMKLLELKATLTSQFSELQSNLKRPLEEALPLHEYENDQPQLKRIATELEIQHNLMRTYRNTVLLKWDDRTKLLTPGAHGKKVPKDEFDIVRKIENALLNRDILISKSRVIRNPENHVTDESKEEENENEKEESQTSDPNVYDDSDFYYQQLRELIEYKTNSSTNAGEVTKQLLELQKVRQKMKRKVDTRASKGRKVRYTVHNKLVNFMAPDDTASINWPEESKDELYKSLFAT